MKTYSAKPTEINHKWFVVDAVGCTLGRLASVIATYLRGKHKPEYTPHMSMGDYVIVLNADKITVTGNKTKDKMYHRHTGYPGGIRTSSFEQLLQRSPEQVIQHAVKGMLPRGPLGRTMLDKLKVYGGSLHPHTAQQPEVLQLATQQ